MSDLTASPLVLRPRCAPAGSRAFDAFRPGAALWYSILFALVQLGGPAFCLWATTQPWFLEHDHYPRLRSMGYSLRAKGMACEIVVYGDSTALAGLNPAVIQRITGLKTCNLAETRPVEEVEGVDFPLDQYLRHNPAPRYILASWSPDDFGFEHPHLRQYSPEGYLYALQYDRGRWLWQGMLRDRTQTVAFLAWAWGALVEDLFDRVTIVHPEKPVDELARRQQASGAWAYTSPPQTHCEFRAFYPETTLAQNRVSIAAFVQRYQVPGTEVIVNVAPVADCDRDRGSYADLIRGLPQNTLQFWPIGLFNSQNVHLNATGADRYSTQAARQILSRIQGANARPIKYQYVSQPCLAEGAGLP